jgi:uncharacterized membrane protein
MNKTANLFVGAAIAGILSASGAGMLNAKPAEAKGECHGVNACKGKGACGGKEGHSCAGQNSCKGKGWLSLTEKDCKTKGGEFKPAGMNM